MKRERKKIGRIVSIILFTAIVTICLQCFTSTNVSAAEYPELYYGCTGESVTVMQELLNQNGANLDLDGNFGPCTLQAVYDYQGAHGLDYDGICGPQTWNSLNTQVVYFDYGAYYDDYTRNYNASPTGESANLIATYIWNGVTNLGIDMSFYQTHTYVSGYGWLTAEELGEIVENMMYGYTLDMLNWQNEMWNTYAQFY